MKLIKVKIINEVLNEAGQKKIDALQKSAPEEPRDEYNRTALWYEENSLPCPSELRKKTSEYENIGMEDSDYEYVWSWGYFKLKDFKAVVDEENGGSTVYSGDLVLRVVESARQIKNQIEKLSTTN